MSSPRPLRSPRRASRRPAPLQAGTRSPVPHLARQTQRFQEAGGWPLEECLLNEDWRERGIGAVVFVRRAPIHHGAGSGPGPTRSRERAVVGLVVDLFCFGVREVRVAAPTDLAGQHSLVEAVGRRWPMRRADPHLAARIVHAGHAWADALGLPQDPVYGWARSFFGGIDHEACTEEVRCGRDGKPVVFAGRPEPTQRLVAHLEQRLGPRSYHLVAPLECVPEG